MPKIGDVIGKKVFKSKTDRKGVTKSVRLGRAHLSVFSPDGRHLAGYLIKQPDIAGMVKRPDVFVAFDSLAKTNEGYALSHDEDACDEAACSRLGLDWDRCIMWTGMDAKTASGKELGYVNDASYDRETGLVECFFVGDGGVSQSLVGSLEIPAAMLLRYERGFMIVANRAADLKPNGGAAAVAGESYAKAKVEGSKAAKKAGAAACEAVDKGSYAFGRALGKAKRAISDVMSDDESEEQAPSAPALDVVVSETDSSDAGKLRMSEEERLQAPKVSYAPATKVGAKPKSPAKPASQKKTSSSKAATKASSQAKRVGGMFGAFMDEYKKASK